MQPLLDLDIAAWDGAVDADTRARAVDALEDGRVVFFPHLAFPLAAGELPLLDPAVSDGKAKNVTWFPDKRLLKGVAATADRAALAALLERYAATARRFVETLFPGYAGALAWGPTTLRPVEIAGRPAPSWRRDDTRLHTDAFPSRPTGGTRILRVFSNVDPAGTRRVWRVGGRFEDFAAPRVGAVRGLVPGEAAVLAALGITGGRRSLYDHLMLALHDRMKSDPPISATASPPRSPSRPGRAGWCSPIRCRTRRSPAGTRWSRPSTCRCRRSASRNARRSGSSSASGAKPWRHDRSTAGGGRARHRAANRSCRASAAAGRVEPPDLGPGHRTRL